MRRLVLLGLTAVAFLAGCNQHDAKVVGRDTSPAEKVNMPDQFDTVATKCSHGFRIFETNDDGALAVVKDPTCGDRP